MNTEESATCGSCGKCSTCGQGKVNNVCGVNMCGGHTMMGGCYTMSQHHILRKVLMIILLIVIFSIGVCLGELKSEIRESRYQGYRMMGNWNYDNGNYGYGMMNKGWLNDETGGPTIIKPQTIRDITTTTTTAPAVKK